MTFGSGGDTQDLRRIVRPLIPQLIGKTWTLAKWRLTPLLVGVRLFGETDDFRTYDVDADKV